MVLSAEESTILWFAGPLSILATGVPTYFLTLASLSINPLFGLLCIPFIVTGNIKFGKIIGNTVFDIINPYFLNNGYTPTCDPTFSYFLLDKGYKYNCNNNYIMNPTIYIWLLLFLFISIVTVIFIRKLYNKRKIVHIQNIYHNLIDISKEENKKYITIDAYKLLSQEQQLKYLYENCPPVSSAELYSKYPEPLCVICSNSQPKVIFHPCSHQILCQTCDYEHLWRSIDIILFRKGNIDGSQLMNNQFLRLLYPNINYQCPICRKPIHFRITK